MVREAVPSKTRRGEERGGGVGEEDGGVKERESSVTTAGEVGMSVGVGFSEEEER